MRTVMCAALLYGLIVTPLFADEEDKAMEKMKIYIDRGALGQPLSSEDASLVAEVQRAVELAERAGMIVLAAHDRTRLRPLRERRIAAIGIEPLSVEDREIWEAWLSTFCKEKDWQQYNMNGIPFQIRELIVSIREAQLFDELLIRGWAKRSKHPDMPRDGLALFGLFGDRVYLLARWAASWNGPEEHLPTFEEIRTSVRTKQERDQAIAWEAKRVEEERNRVTKRMRDIRNISGSSSAIGALLGILFGLVFTALSFNIAVRDSSWLMRGLSIFFILVSLASLVTMMYSGHREARRSQELEALQKQYPDIAEFLRVERSLRR